MNRRLRSITGTLEGSDPWLLGAMAVLLLLGSSVVYGTGSFSRHASTSLLGQHYIIAKHILVIGAGLVLMGGLVQFDYHRFRQRWLSWSFLAVALVLVAITLYSSRGINRWIYVFGFSVQPVEAAKIAMILFLGDRLTCQRRGRELSWRQMGLAVSFGVLPLVLLLVMQPNYGNVMVTVGVTVAMLLVAGAPLRWLGGIMGGGIVVGAAAFLLIPKLNHRLFTWLDGIWHGRYPYQVDQSLIGLGAGGWRGLGVGQSHNKFMFLPESHTDFAFSVLGEELGLFGTLMVLAAFVLVVWRGYHIAARAAEPFGQVVATGLTTGLAIYGVANIAMVTGIFPVVGVPLPFVSYGGSSMIGGLAAIGILLNIERSSRSYQEWKRRWDRA